jgi:hypothetical protein
MKSTHRSIGIQCITLVLGWVIAVSVHADFKRDYGSGVRDYTKGDYGDAITALQKAIDQESKAQEKVRIYGMRYEPYMPYFFLGQAKFKNGDCAGALAAYKESLAQAVVQNQDKYPELQANMASCDSVKVDVTRIAQSAQDAIDKLQDDINLFAKLETEQLLSSEWNSRWQPELTRARTTSQTLPARLQTAIDETDEAGIQAIQTKAQGATSAINDARSLAVARVSSIRENQAQDANKQLGEAREALVRAISTGKSIDIKQGSAQMGTLQQQLETLLAQGESTIDSGSADPRQFRELAQNISNLGRRYNLAEQDWQAEQRQKQLAAENAAEAKAAEQRRIPPNALKQVAEAYFAGNYQSAVELSNPNSLREDRAKVQAFLFRAAASHKLFILSGEKNTQARQRSEDDIRAIKRLDKSFKPYIAAFSPSFLELFRQTG